jgi:hypothetical protein
MTALIRVDTQPGRERPLVIACLAVLVALCWACLVFRALRIATLDPASSRAAPYPVRRSLPCRRPTVRRN